MRVNHLGPAEATEVRIAGNFKKQFAKSYFFTMMEEMADRSYLGEFELMILLVVVHLGDEAYGVPVCRELGKRRKQEVSIGSVYAALERLEAKGLISSRLGEATQIRGGRAKRFFQTTKEGLRVIRETRQVLTSLWRKLPDLEGQTL